MKGKFCIPVFFFVFLTMLCCTSTNKIQSNMNSDNYSLAYLNDSKINEHKIGISVSIDTVLNKDMEMKYMTEVKKENGWFVPLLFFNIWGSKSTCTLGKSAFAEDVPEFFKSALETEIERSGVLHVNDTSEYSLSVNIEKINTEGPYKSFGYFYIVFYVYGWYYGDVAGPAVSDISVSYTLKKGGKTIIRNTLQASKETDPIAFHHNSTKDLQTSYSISMVEAVSYNMKNIIEDIVADLNRHFSNDSFQTNAVLNQN